MVYNGYIGIIRKVEVLVEKKVVCPKCGNSSISAGNKGFGLGKAAAGGILIGPVGLLGGLIGSKKVMASCLNCGNKWEPGKVKVKQEIEYDNSKSLWENMKNEWNKK